MGAPDEATVVRAVIRAKCQLTVPAQVREALHVGEDDQVEFRIEPNGDVTLRGMRMIATDQAWFWTPEWQAGEREADEDLAAGRVTRQDSFEEFIDALEARMND